MIVEALEKKISSGFIRKSSNVLASGTCLDISSQGVGGEFAIDYFARGSLIGRGSCCTIV